MKTILCGWALCAGLAAFAAATPASGKEVPAAEARAIRVVVEAQLDAFGRDDADQAFSYAAPSIQQMFGSPGNFMRMVRIGYPVVYRPASVVFLKPERLDGDGLDGDVMQSAQMTDEAGQVWVAHYRMQRQPNHTWRIGGCQVEKKRGASFTAAACLIPGSCAS